VLGDSYKEFASRLNNREDQFFKVHFKISSPKLSFFDFHLSKHIASLGVQQKLKFINDNVLKGMNMQEAQLIFGQ
jgi:hypothetical protein